MPVSISKTRICHVKSLYQIERECFNDPWSMDSLKHEVTHPNSICLVATDEAGKILGHVTMRKIIDEGYINNIAVRRAARRNGIGAKLIAELVLLSRQSGLNAMTLEVRSKNTAAISLYKKFGFFEQGLRKNYYANPEDDAIIMWKENL